MKKNFQTLFEIIWKKHLLKKRLLRNTAGFHAMSQKNVCSRAVKTRSFISQDKSSFPNVKFMIFVTFENRDKTCSKIEKTRRNFSLVARYSLKFTRCSLLVAKFTRYSLQKFLVAKNHSLLVAEVALCKKWLVTRCKIRLLLVAEVARCKNSLISRCKIHLLLVTEDAHCKKSLVTRCRSCSL